MYVVQSKNGIMMNVRASAENDFKGDYMWNPSACNCECNKACKIDKCLDDKNVESSYLVN